MLKLDNDTIMAPELMPVAVAGRKLPAFRAMR